MITGIAGIAWHLNGDLPPGQNLILRQDLQSHEELPDLTDSDLEITTDISNIIQKSKPNGIFHDISNIIQKSGNPITIFLLFLRYEIWYVHLFYMPQCSWKGSEVTNLGGVDQCFLWLHVAKPVVSLCTHLPFCHGVIGDTTRHARCFVNCKSTNPCFCLSNLRITKTSKTLILHGFPHVLPYVWRDFFPFSRGAPRRRTCPKWRRRARRSPGWRRPSVDVPRGPTASEPSEIEKWRNPKEKWIEILIDEKYTSMCI